MSNSVTLPFLLRVDAWILVSVLFILMVVLIRVGAYLGRHQFLKDEYQQNPANSTIYNSIFGMLAFLLAFTFGMSGTRYESRRQVIIVEANAIGTAILRADLYPYADRLALRRYFKQYLQARIDYIMAGADLDKIHAADRARDNSEALLWGHAIAFSKENPSVIISGQMVPGLNHMFDSATVTRNSELMRVPQSIVIMLFALSLIAAFFVGYISIGKGRLDWFTSVGFCFLTSLVIFITLDLDRPRRGLIQMEGSWQSIISLMTQLEDQK